MNKIKQVAWREIVFQLKKRDFYFSTFGAPLLGIVIFLAVQLTGGTANDNVLINTLVPTTKGMTIGIVDDAAVITNYTDLISPTKVLLLDSPSAGEQALRDETISTLYLIPADYRATGVVTRTTRSVGSSSANTALVTLLMANHMQTAPVTLALRLHEPLVISKTVTLGNNVRIAGDLDTNASASSVPTLFAMGIYLAIFMGASLLMQGILEEKENRTLEILLTSVSPRQLLLGKLLGLGFVALVQLLTWAILGILFWRGGSDYVASFKAISIPLSAWFLLVIFFMLGYVFYATLMAGIGAISPSMRELSQLIIIVTIPAIIPILFLPAMLTKPNGALALTLSLIPFTAPSTMMLRQVMTIVPLWQTLLSIAVLVLSVIGALRLIARLFKATTLLVGSKLTLRQLWRALR